MEVLYVDVIILYAIFVLYQGLVMDWFNLKHGAEAFESDYKLFLFVDYCISSIKILHASGMGCHPRKVY